MRSTFFYLLNKVLGVKPQFWLLPVFLGFFLGNIPTTFASNDISYLNYASSYMSANQNVDTTYPVLNFDTLTTWASSTPAFNTSTHGYTLPVSGCYWVYLTAFVYTGASPYVDYVGIYLNSNELDRSYLHPFSNVAVTGEAYSNIFTQDIICGVKGDVVKVHGYGSPTATIVGGLNATRLVIYQLDYLNNFMSSTSPLYVTIASSSPILHYGDWMFVNGIIILLLAIIPATMLFSRFKRTKK